MSDAPAADYSPESYARGLHNELSVFPDDTPIFHRPQCREL